MILSRRSLFTGLVSFVAAPAIVRASSLMPVNVIPNEWVTAAQTRLALQNRWHELAELLVRPPLGPDTARLEATWLKEFRLIGEKLEIRA